MSAPFFSPNAPGKTMAHRPPLPAEPSPVSAAFWKQKPGSYNAICVFVKPFEKPRGCAKLTGLFFLPNLGDKQILFLADIGIEKVCKRSDLIEKASTAGAMRVFQRRECKRDFSAILSPFPPPKPRGRGFTHGTIARMTGRVAQEVPYVLRDEQPHGLPCGVIHQAVQGR